MTVREGMHRQTIRSTCSLDSFSNSYKYRELLAQSIWRRRRRQGVSGTKRLPAAAKLT
jgi:hypothetical protein